MHDEAYDRIYRGDRPVLVAAPHVGTAVPDELMRSPAWQSVHARPADPAGERFLEAAPICGSRASRRARIRA